MAACGHLWTRVPTAVALGSEAHLILPEALQALAPPVAVVPPLDGGEKQLVTWRTRVESPGALTLAVRVGDEIDTDLLDGVQSPHDISLEAPSRPCQVPVEPVRKEPRPTFPRGGLSTCVQ